MLYRGILLILFYISLFATESAAQKRKTTSFFFDTDLSVLDEKQKEAFSQFVSEMEAEDIVSISILGYCDDRGRKGYNDTLSVKRANYVKDLLHQRGINTEKVKLLTGHG
ncbi:MAG: OmpA family protein, partial [Pedobacter sp.]